MRCPAIIESVWEGRQNRGMGRGVVQKRLRKHVEMGEVIKGSSWNRWVRNLCVTNELFYSNWFNDDNVKIITNYDPGDTII